MTVKPHSESVDGSGGWGKFTPRMMKAYVASYRGPQGDAPAIGERGLTAPAQVRAHQVLTPAMTAAHGELGHSRKPGATNIAIYPEDDPRGLGPALQVVADEAPMLMESVTVLLNRLHVPYVSTMSPVFRVRRSPDGVLEDLRVTAEGGNATPGGVDEAWIHVELAAGADRKTLEEVQRQLPLGDHRRSAGRPRFHGDEGGAAHAGRRPRQRQLQPLCCQQASRGGAIAALARRRSLRDGRLPALLGGRRRGSGRRLQPSRCAAAATRCVPSADRIR